MAWVATQQDQLYADLNATMEAQTLQAEMTSDLATIKNDVQKLNGHPTKDGALALLAQIDAFHQRYGAEPGFASLRDTVKEIGASIEVQVKADKPVHWAESTMAAWNDSIDKQLGAVGTNQQLGMIHVSELRNNIDETSRYASQFVKGTHDTTSSIINNIA